MLSYTVGLQLMFLERFPFLGSTWNTWSVHSQPKGLYRLFAYFITLINSTQTQFNSILVLLNKNRSNKKSNTKGVWFTTELRRNVYNVKYNIKKITWVKKTILINFKHASYYLTVFCIVMCPHTGWSWIKRNII